MPCTECNAVLAFTFKVPSEGAACVVRATCPKCQTRLKINIKKHQSPTRNTMQAAAKLMEKAAEAIVKEADLYGGVVRLGALEKN